MLAGGDTEFQSKCPSKMNELAHGGRTALFVSHNITAVEALCKSAIYLDSGSLRMSGATSDVVSGYSKSNAKTSLHVG